MDCKTEINIIYLNEKGTHTHAQINMLNTVKLIIKRINGLRLLLKPIKGIVLNDWKGHFYN